MRVAVFVGLAASLATAGVDGQSVRPVAALTGDSPPPNGICVETVGLDAMFQRRGRPVAGGVRTRRGAIGPITLRGTTFKHGIGTQSISEFLLDVKGQAKGFQAMVGLDDSATLLQLGIYSSPGRRTCQGLPGSYQHEASDGKTWAAWGVDYLKYDHCSYDRVDPGHVTVGGVVPILRPQDLDAKRRILRRPAWIRPAVAQRRRVASLRRDGAARMLCQDGE